MILSDASAVRILANGPEPIRTQGEDGGSGIGAAESGTDGRRARPCRRAAATSTPRYGLPCHAFSRPGCSLHFRTAFYH